MLRMRGSSQGGCSLQEKKRRQRKHVTARLCGALRDASGLEFGRVCGTGKT